MPRGEEYESLACDLVVVRPKSILVKVDDEEHWLARSCLWGPQEIELDRLSTPIKDFEIKVMPWLLRKEGL